jgi:SAM-dependent methyltransferase
MDSIEAFKALQKEGWANFAPLEMMTTIPAARLMRFAGVRAGQQVLDVACGTGVVAITAARAGAQVTGLDLTPELLERARHNSRIATVQIDWREGDVEKMPFGDGAFDVILSQFGHIFAPRPTVAIAEMLRVLKPGGTIAFSTWPPELFMGRMFSLVAAYLPPATADASPPVLWGDAKVVRERLGTAVKDIVFDIETILCPALSPQHFRATVERTVGPVIQLIDKFSTEDPAKVDAFRREYDALAKRFFDQNAVRQTYLLTRAVKN